MSLHIRFLPEAKAEFDEAADWYEDKQIGLGVDFVARVRQTLNRIAVNPRLHATVYQDIRKAIVSRFPYVVLYREASEELLVVAVFHTSRDPTQWQSRA